MATMVIAFKLDDDEVGIDVKAEEVNASTAIGPVAELLGEYQETVLERLDLRSKQGLEVDALLQA
jgi:hypothetical protein